MKAHVEEKSLQCCTLLQAVDELFKMMRLMATKYQDCSEDEIKAINSFRRNTIQLYLQNLDARSGWQTLIGLVV